MATPNTPSGFISHIKSGPAATPQEYREIRDTLPDIVPMFDALKGRADVSVQDIESYVLDVDRPLNAFEKYIFKVVSEMREEGIPAADRAFAESTLQSLANYMNKRNTVIIESEVGLHNLQTQVQPEGMSKDQMPALDPLNVTGTLQKGAKDLLRTYSNTKNTSDKVLLLAGASAALLLTYFGAKALFTTKKGLFRHSRNIIGTVIGVGVAGLAINRAAALTWGSPIISLDTNIGRQPMAHNWLTGKKWDETVYKQQLEQAVTELKSKNIDDAFIEKMLGTGGTSRDVRYVKGITNFGTLSVQEFLEVYERSRDTKQVSDADWPNYPCSDSKQLEKQNLKPTERFAIMEEMAKTLELVDADGEVKTDIKEEELNESVFVKILNRP